MGPITIRSKLTFSGHETFQCRALWLKKGYDFLRKGLRFNEPDSVVHLGVGKNMVTSIRFWMTAFGLQEDNKLTELANFLFSRRGRDHYLENPTSLWLLHYQLVTNQMASLYSIVFNEFRKERTEFSKSQLQNFIKRRCSEANVSVSANTVDKDIGVFLKNYLRPNGVRNPEDEFSGLFLDLHIVREITTQGVEDGKRYAIYGDDRKDIPPELVLFCILDNERYGKSVSFHELLNGFNSVGSVFAMNSDGLLEKILSLTKQYNFITYTDDAGIRELQFQSKLDKWSVLNGYYAN